MRSLFDSLHTPSSFNPMSRRPPGRRGRGLGLGWLLWCALAGLAQAASLAWPLPWPVAGLVPGEPSGALQIASLAAFLLALMTAPRVGAAALRGWVFATAWLAGTFWWLFISMHTYGGLAPWLAVVAVGALAGALALYYALAAGLLAALAPASRAGQALMFAALWTLAELARGVLFTGFPWGAGGYAQVDLMPAWAPWVGVYGMGFVAAVLAYAVAAALHGGVDAVARWLLSPVSRPPRAGSRIPAPVAAARRAPWAAWTPWSLVRAAVSAAALAALLLTLGPAEGWRAAGSAATAPAGELRVWLLQGAIPQDQKFVPGTGVAQALDWYPAQVREAVVAAQGGSGPRLVVAPETAIPVLPQQLDARFWTPLLQPIAGQTGAEPVAWMTGVPLGNAREGYTNAAWGITPEAAAAALQGSGIAGAAFHRYDKHHLVPFGEFIPPLFRWFVAMMNIPLGDFNRGALGQAPWSWAGQRIAPNICYEDLFGEELAAAFADPRSAPTVLLNLSNIAWFGDSVAIDQHLHISRLRALELGRPMLRATNTGATAVIDHRGVVTHRLPSQQRGRLEATVAGRSGLTPFARWAAAGGLWPVAGVCLALVVGLVIGQRVVGRRVPAHF